MKTFPVHSIKDGLCTCGNKSCSSPGKHPKTPNGVKDAVEQWDVTKFEPCNIGIATGKVNGFFVVDVDMDKGGDVSLEELTQRGLPETKTVQTGTGLHLYFNLPPSNGLSNRAGVMPGIDIRSDGGYVVGPGSIHRNGKTYQLLNDLQPVDAPDWLLSMIKSPSNAPDCPRIDAKVLTYTLGARNDSLYRLGRSLRSKGASDDTIIAALNAQNSSCVPPLSEAELLGIANQVMNQPNRSDYVKAKEVKKPELKVYSCKEFVELDIPPVEWILDMFVPKRSIIMFSAFQKTGKTTLLYEMLTSIASGKDFIGLGATKSNVLLINAEEGDTIVKERLIRLAKNEEGMFVTHRGEKGGIRLSRSDDFYESLRKTIAEKKIDLVAIDPLSSFMLYEKEDASAEIVKSFIPLQEIRDELGVSFFLVHHTGKTEYTQHTKAARGSSSFGGCADMIITMTGYHRKTNYDKKEDDDQIINTEINTKRTIEASGRVIDSHMKIAVDFDLTTLRYKLTGNSAEAVKKTRMYRLWLTLNGEPIPISELVKRTGGHEKTIRRYLSDLEETGHARCVTPVGKSHAKYYARGSVNWKN